jgi:ATPase subunit of ABC transporter with duplicated ATPase domains
MNDVCRSFGQKEVLKNISLSFLYGAKIGVIGENGAGKSTLLKIMAGIDKDFQGETRLTSGMKLRYVAQEPQLDLNKTVRENLLTAVKPILDMVEKYNEISNQLAEPQSDEKMNKLMEDLAVYQDKIDACEGWEIDRLIDIVSDAMVLPGDDTPVNILSGGERRRVALCMALLEKPDLLLLDEPTNHLDAETVQWLETALRDYPGTVIIVTHDRYFLDNITKWILELDKGRGLPFEGNYSSWLKQKAEILRVTEKQQSQRQKTLARELEWINTSVKARNVKNQARINSFNDLSAQSQAEKQNEILIQIPSAQRLGDKVLTFTNVNKKYNGSSLIENCSFELPANAIAPAANISPPGNAFGSMRINKSPTVQG